MRFRLCRRSARRRLPELSSIILFKGTANQLDIDVVAPPVVTATATGVRGGASVTYDEPILTVR
jgi:hypothetical protein